MDWRAIKWHYVNLASRPDRQAHAEEQFRCHNIQAERFEAFVHTDWPVARAAEVAIMQRSTPGAIGCYMSQATIIGRAAAGPDEVVAVCEDDVVFSVDLRERLQYIQEHLTWDWDIFYLGATFHVPGKWCHEPDCAGWSQHTVDVEPTADRRIMRTYGAWGTYAYLVNAANAEKVLSLLDENLHRSRGIDHNFMMLGDKVNSYCLVPGCAWQYDNKSDIGHGDTIFSNFRRLGPYVWTDRMEDFDPARFDWNTGVTL